MGWFYFFAWDAVCTVWRDRRSLILAVLFIAAAVGLLFAVELDTGWVKP